MRLNHFAWAVLLWVASAQAATLNPVVFDTTTPPSTNLELARRMLTPLTAAQLPALLARADSGLRAQPLDPSKEQFVVYVPSQKPEHGYGLLVFIPPWEDARLPDGWGPVLDRYGMLFVSAARSGNPENVLARRVPLAIIAEQNMVRRYPVDPARIYIGGFSGGSRVALHMALAYSDLFRGALLDAGSDPVGNAALPLPPKALVDSFQTERFVYLTGNQDIIALGMAAESRHSLRDWCAFDTANLGIPQTGHRVADPFHLSRALDLLEQPDPPDAARLAECRAGLESQLDAKLAAVAALVAAGHRAEAQQALNDIDVRFGGLAAPRSLALQKQIDASAGSSPPASPAAPAAGP